MEATTRDSEAMELQDIIIRLAQAADKAAVLNFCQHTWPDTEDYIAEVWDVWMADPSGQILVAEFEGQAIAMTRVVQLSEQEGWWEGLRVDPQYRGRGVARSLDPAIAHYFETRHISTIRCCVGAWNHAMPEIIQRRGYEPIASYQIYSAAAPVRMASDVALPKHLRQLTVEDYEKAWQWIQKGQGTLPLFVCRGAKWQTLTQEQLQERVQGGKVWGYWPHQQLQSLLIQSYLENADAALWVGHVEGNPDGLMGLLEAMKSLAFHLKYPKVSGFFPKTQPLLTVLEQVGYCTSSKDEFWVYEKRA